VDIGVAGKASAWQPGWCGALALAFALMKGGGELEWERGRSSLDFLFSMQHATGLFPQDADADGKAVNMLGSGREHWAMLRQTCDALKLAFKCFSLFDDRGQEIPNAWLAGASKAADALVHIWEKNGQWGQFYDLEKDKIAVGGSTNAAAGISVLVAAYRRFRQGRYLEVAKAAGELFYIRDAARGYTCGGPGDALQSPDSESCYALLGGLLDLYDATLESTWLARARHVANLFSSWVVPYNYRFPPKSEFGKLNMHTVGTVFANTANKHSAPGICTESGAALYRLYQYTQDARYLQLFKEIALTIGQYVSTDVRPIYSWDMPKDAVARGLEDVRVEPERLVQGTICERVNMSDWEGPRCIGGVFNGNCWCQAAHLLTLVDAMPLLEP
jgi:hypothetical protein